MLPVSNSTSGIFIVKWSTYFGAAAAIMLAFSPILASSREEGVLLSPSDYVYLDAQGVQRDSPVLQQMSPKELRRLHQVINDEKTQSDAQSKANAVLGALADFEGGQQWDKSNPKPIWKPR